MRKYFGVVAMPKLSPRAAALKRLRNKADALWQQCAKLEHPRCEVCGKPTQVGHHFFTKGSSAELRYELENGIGLCAGCHLRHHKGAPDIHVCVVYSRTNEWVDGLRSTSHWYVDLFTKRNTIRKRNPAYYEGEIERLTERLGGTGGDMSGKRSAAALNIDEKMDIIGGIRSVAGNDIELALMIRKKAHEQRVQEDTIRLVVMGAAMLIQGEQLEIAKCAAWNDGGGE